VLSLSAQGKSEPIARSLGKSASTRCIQHDGEIAVSVYHDYERILSPKQQLTQGSPNGVMKIKYSIMFVTHRTHRKCLRLKTRNLLPLSIFPPHQSCNLVQTRLHRGLFLFLIFFFWDAVSTFLSGSVSASSGAGFLEYGLCKKHVHINESLVCL
jgi:hypothetical protein